MRLHKSWETTKNNTGYAIFKKIVVRRSSYASNKKGIPLLCKNGVFNIKHVWDIQL